MGPGVNERWPMRRSAPSPGVSPVTPYGLLLIFYFLAVLVVFGWFSSVEAQAQTCWVYTDNQISKTPISCVQKNNNAQACAWPADCTTVPAAPGSQTIRTMHEAWHACF